MKTKLLLGLLIVVVIGGIILWNSGKKTQSLTTNSEPTPLQEENSQQKDIDAIRSFMSEPNLELSFINIGLPTQYFRVGKITKVGNGENMDAVDTWTRNINVYDQKELINKECSVYEFNTDARNHNLTAVIIRGLRQNEIENLKNSGKTCDFNSKNVQKLTKTQAETIAMGYLKRALPNFDQIKDQFVYSSQNNGESHEWLWQDKNYKLPEGLSSRPYPGPIIRISFYGDNQIQYWNTTSLFAN
ncbi:MAG: hypothetical protein WCV93_03170 [Candidatus Shapirobacteria bacterium]|jgi:hypothetical protein